MFSKDVTKHKKFATSNDGGLDENKSINSNNYSSNNNNIRRHQHYSPSHSNGMDGGWAASTPQRSNNSINNNNQAADKALSPLFQFMATEQDMDRQELEVMGNLFQLQIDQLTNFRAMRRFCLEAVVEHGIAANNSSSSNINNNNQATDQALLPLFQFMAAEQVTDRLELALLGNLFQQQNDELTDFRAMRRFRLEAVVGHGIAVNNNINAGVVAVTDQQELAPPSSSPPPILSPNTSQFMAGEQTTDQHEMALMSIIVREAVGNLTQELGVMSATVREAFGNLTDSRALRRSRLEAAAWHEIATNNNSNNNNNSNHNTLPASEYLTIAIGAPPSSLPPQILSPNMSQFMAAEQVTDREELGVMGILFQQQNLVTGFQAMRRLRWEAVVGHGTAAANNNNSSAGVVVVSHRQEPAATMPTLLPDGSSGGGGAPLGGILDRVAESEKKGRDDAHVGRVCWLWFDEYE